MRDLGAFFGPIFVIFRRASFSQKYLQVIIQWYTQYGSFSRYIFPKWILSQCFSVTRPGRPSDPAARHGSQVIKLVRVPVFLSSQVMKLFRVPVFLSSKLSQNGSCSSISQFKTESNWFVFQYFSVQNWVKMVRVPVFLSSKLIKMNRFLIFS